jgi:geranylgeranyl diphosphate synthase type I
MSFEEVLDEQSRLVEIELKRFLGEERLRGHGYHQLIGQLYDAIEEYSTRGGKRLAACSTLVTYEGYTGHIDDRIVKVACGVEVYRHCILVHDDLVDRDETRRGGSTLHMMMIGEMDNRFGQGTAVFAGDILSSMALRPIIHSGFEAEKILEVVDMINTEYQEVNESQILDLMFEYTSPDRIEWEIMASKRAASLFRATLLAGAILGEAPAEDLFLLREAGEHIGFAFDIQDDIIDTFASEEQYGRVPCGDVHKGKKPLHIVLAMEKDDRFAQLIIQAYRREGAVDMEEVRSRIVESGALDEAKDISRQHADIAMERIRATSMEDRSKDFFISFIDFVKESLDWYK